MRKTGNENTTRIADAFTRLLLLGLPKAAASVDTTAKSLLERATRLNEKWPRNTNVICEIIANWADDGDRADDGTIFFPSYQQIDERTEEAVQRIRAALARRGTAGRSNEKFFDRIERLFDEHDPKGPPATTRISQVGYSRFSKLMDDHRLMNDPAVWSCWLLLEEGRTQIVTTRCRRARAHRQQSGPAEDTFEKTLSDLRDDPDSGGNMRGFLLSLGEQMERKRQEPGSMEDF